jgi:Ion channel
VYTQNKGLHSEVTVVLNQSNNYLRSLAVLATVPLLILILIRQYQSFRLDKSNLYLRQSASFWQSRHLKLALLELVINGVISPPGWEDKICYPVMARGVCNPLSDLFMLVAILRLYLVLRVYCHCSQWTNEHSREICDVNMAAAGMLFVVRCQFKKRPFTSLFFFILCIALISAYAIRIFERAYYASAPAIDNTMDGFQDYENFWNVLWLTAVTMTTVGYGDYYCKSHFGRFTTTLATMLGILTISLMLVSLEQTTKLNQYQALSYEFIFKLQSREQIRHHSAVIVAEVLRVCLLKKRQKKLQ